MNGEIAFISGTEEKLELDQAALMQFLLEACGDFNLEAEIHPKRKKKEEASAAPAVPAPKPDDVVLLEEIRDLLKNQK